MCQKRSTLFVISPFTPAMSKCKYRVHLTYPPSPWGYFWLVLFLVPHGWIYHYCFEVQFLLLTTDYKMVLNKPSLSVERTSAGTLWIFTRILYCSYHCFGLKNIKFSTEKISTSRHYARQTRFSRKIGVNYNCLGSFTYERERHSPDNADNFIRNE